MTVMLLADADGPAITLFAKSVTGMPAQVRQFLLVREHARFPEVPVKHLQSLVTADGVLHVLEALPFSTKPPLAMEDKRFTARNLVPREEQ